MRARRTGSRWNVQYDHERTNTTNGHDHAQSHHRTKNPRRMRGTVNERIPGRFPHVSGGVFPISVSGCVSRLYGVCIHVYQGVSWATRYTLIRPDTVPIHADTKSAPLSSVSDCKIQRDDSKKRDRVRISDVSTSVSGIVSVKMYPVCI